MAYTVRGFGYLHRMVTDILLLFLVDMRMVKLKCILSANKRTLTVTGPPNAAGK